MSASPGVAALDRALSRGTLDTKYAEDGERIAKVVRKYWGDEGETVLRLAVTAFEEQNRVYDGG